MADAPDDLASRFSLEAFCGAHVEQLAFVTDRSPRVHAMCARQSGKTQGDVAILVDNATKRSDTTNIFLGLNGPSVRTNVWEPIFKRIWSVCEFPDKWLNVTRMMANLPNGSRIMFGGTDDIRHIKNILGGRLDGGVFIIDESQDQGGVLDELLDVTLPPMLTKTSRLILTGVFPEVPAGRFWRERSNPGWSRHNWGRLANVHTPEAAEILAEHLRVNQLTIDDPQIERDWGGKPVFSPRATAYKYRPEVNGYHHSAPDWLAAIFETHEHVYTSPAGIEVRHDLKFSTPMSIDDERPRVGLMAAVPEPWVERFSFAIDPGATADRAAIEGVGWGQRSRRIQHVFDWATPRGANLTTGQIFALAGLAHAMYSPRGHCKWRYDAGSSQNSIDNLKSDYGLPLILAATKMDMKGQVDRNNDLLEQGRFQVMFGSALEQDYQKARWDKGARETGQWKWAGGWHPDPSEAGRYAIQDYRDFYRDPVNPAARNPDPFEAKMRQLEEKAQHTPGNYFSARIRGTA